MVFSSAPLDSPEPPSKEGVVEKIARVGIMGFCSILIVATVCAIAGYAVYKGIDNETVQAYHTVLQVAAGGVLVGAGKFFGNNEGASK